MVSRPRAAQGDAWDAQKDMALAAAGALAAVCLTECLHRACARARPGWYASTPPVPWPERRGRRRRAA